MSDLPFVKIFLFSVLVGFVGAMLITVSLQVEELVVAIEREQQRDQVKVQTEKQSAEALDEEVAMAKPTPPIDKKRFDAVARSIGRKVKLAQEVWYNESSGRPGSESYTCQLEDLLSFDKSLSYDPELTFEFSYCGQNGYHIMVKHLKGEREFEFVD